MTARIGELLEHAQQNPNTLYNNDFLLTWEQEDATLRTLITLVQALEQMYRAQMDLRVFQGQLAVSNFRDKSTRTMFSFASAANLLGLAVKDLDEAKSQIAHGETVRETATMISFLTQIIGIRDDLYIHQGHSYMKELSDALEESFRADVLPQRPGVINLQCDLDHPTQTMADLVHLQDHFGGLQALAGKKVAMTWAYSPSYGKPLSVPQGIIGLLPRFGMDVVLAHPEGYDLLPECIDVAQKQAAAGGGSFRVTHSMEEAFDGAQVVYPKSWASYRVMEQRTELFQKGSNPQALAELERNCLAENGQHTRWECTEEMMARTHQGQGLYMHCLPADITGVSCEKGEVSASVFERYRLATYKEASHKPFVIAAMMLMMRQQKPAQTLLEIARRHGI